MKEAESETCVVIKPDQNRKLLGLLINCKFVSGKLSLYADMLGYWSYIQAYNACLSEVILIGVK
jgi:hypothetical protein